MRIGIVGCDDDTLLPHAIDYLGKLPAEVTAVYIVDRGKFANDVKEYMGGCQPHVRLVVMQSESQRFGVAATLKRNVALAKEIDLLVAFWDFHESEVLSIVGMAGLYGKKIHVNPHEDGGIVSPKSERVTVAKMMDAIGSDDEGPVT